MIFAMLSGEGGSSHNCCAGLPAMAKKEIFYPQQPSMTPSFVGQQSPCNSSLLQPGFLEHDLFLVLVEVDISFASFVGM